MHECPKCGNPCNCPASKYIGPNGEEILCLHCNPFGGEFYRGKKKKSPFFKKVIKVLQRIDTIIGSLLGLAFMGFGGYLCIVGQLYHGAVVLLLVFIFSTLIRIHQEL